MRIDLAPIVIAVAVALAPSSLMAQQLSFHAAGGGSPSSSIFFVLPANPVPDLVAPDQSYFELFGVSYQQGGFSPCPCDGDFKFYINNGPDTGGFDSPAGYYAGPQLFQGPITSPTFVPGDYSIKYINPASFYNNSQGGVSIAAATGAVPEPGTWALLIVGFAAIGGMMRSRRRERLGAA